MKMITIFFCLLIFEPDTQEVHIIGEYEGGMPYTIWATLELRKNGMYKYHVSTHQSIYTKDEGNWELRDDKIVLNSSRKIKNWVRGEKVGKEKFLFKNFKFKIKENELIYDQRNKFAFKETYFHLVKKVER